MTADLVIFDLDGTLLDTIADLGEAVNHAMAVRGLPLHTTEEYKGMVGHGVRNLVTLALPEGQRDEATVSWALADFRQWYEGHIAVHTRPYPGIPEFLRDLAGRGVRLAVASNKFHEGVVTLISRFFPDIPFVAVLGHRPDLPLKPDAEVVLSILRSTFRSTPDPLYPDPSELYPRASLTAPCGLRQRAVMVGDSGTDIRTAHAGGIAGIGVAWGYRPAATLAAAGADFVVPDVPSLRRLLLDQLL